jgi:hypothetical protein
MSANWRFGPGMLFRLARRKTDPRVVASRPFVWRLWGGAGLCVWIGDGVAAKKGACSTASRAPRPLDATQRLWGPQPIGLAVSA